MERAMFYGTGAAEGIPAAGPVGHVRPPRLITAVAAFGTLAFAADGWICAGLGIAWPMVLFFTSTKSPTFTPSFNSV